MPTLSLTDQENNTRKDDRMLNAHNEYYWPGEYHP